jgi:hypothetical protein
MAAGDRRAERVGTQPGGTTTRAYRGRANQAFQVVSSLPTVTSSP